MFLSTILTSCSSGAGLYGNPQQQKRNQYSCNREHHFVETHAYCLQEIRHSQHVYKKRKYTHLNTYSWHTWTCVQIYMCKDVNNQVESFWDSVHIINSTDIMHKPNTNVQWRCTKIRYRQNIHWIEQSQHRTLDMHCFLFYTWSHFDDA